MRKKNVCVFVMLVMILLLGMTYGCEEKSEPKEYSIENLIKNNIKEESIIKGRIIASNNINYIISDKTSAIIIPKGNMTYVVGNTVIFQGVLNIVNKIPYFESISKTVSMGTINVEEKTQVLDFSYIEEISATDVIDIELIEILGTVIEDNGKCYIKDDDTNILVEVQDEKYNGKVVFATGYITGYNNESKTIDVYYKNISEYSDIIAETSIKDIYTSDLNKTYKVSGTISYNMDSTIILTSTNGYLLCAFKENVQSTGTKVVNITGVLKKSGNLVYLDECQLEETKTIDSIYKENKNITNDEYNSLLQSTNINIKHRVANGKFIYKDNEYYFESENMLFKIEKPASYLSDLIGKDYMVKMYITNSNGEYLISFIDEFTPLEEYGINILNVINSEPDKVYETKGTVSSINKYGFVITDSFASMYVYKGSSWVCDIEIGDVLKVHGMTTEYGSSIQYGESTNYTKVGSEEVNYPSAEIMDESDFYELISNGPLIASFASFKGVLIKSGTYYNVDIEGVNFTGAISYPLEPLYLDSLVGKTVIVTGYVINLRDIYLNMSMNYIEVESEEETGSFKLNILDVNDLHGYCLQDGYSSNGISNMAYMINQIRDANPLDDVVLIGNGDLFQGTAISNISHGLSIVNAMNAMNFDCMVIGNHEFDWGIDKVLNYFDNDYSNGEANFPLLCANIYNKDDDTLLTIENGKMYESMVIEREGVKVGIIGYIGDVYTSISYVMRKDYYFNNDIASSVSKIGKSLKDSGVDVIVVSIHGGESSSITSYSVNQYLAQLKYQDDYLVDAVINGHTHSFQNGLISRTDGTSMPVVQGGSNCRGIGQIVLEIDKATNDVVNANSLVQYVSAANSNYDEDVEEVIQNELEQIYPIISEVYAVAGETVDSTYELREWVANVLVKGTGADVAICNTGGLRSSGDIITGQDITIENLYMINPFDNYIMIVDVLGSDLSRFLNNSAIFSSPVNIVNNKTYKVAVIDYVYYWDSFPQNNTVINSNIIMRDLLIADVKLHDVFKPISEPEALVGLNELSLYDIYKYAIIKEMEY